MTQESTLLIAHLHHGKLLKLVGRGTVKESPAVKSIVMRWMEESVEQIAIDVNECEFLDSTLLGCLIELHKRCQASNVKFVIEAAGKTKQHLFSISCLDKFFRFADSPSQPVGDWVRVDPAQPDAISLGHHVADCHRRLAEMGGAEADDFNAIADRLDAELEQLESWKEGDTNVQR